MKKAIIILIGLLANVFVSCNDEKVTELNMRITELETQNKKLMDSITNLEKSRILNSHIFGFTDKPSYKAGEEINIKFNFYSPEKMSNFSVYTSSEDGKIDELVFDSMAGKGFEYSTTPKIKGEHAIKLWAVVDTNTKRFGEIHVPAYMTINVME